MIRTSTKWMAGRELGQAVFMRAGPELQNAVAERLAALSAERAAALAGTNA